jgi:hypothetical protein
MSEFVVFIKVNFELFYAKSVARLRLRVEVVGFMAAGADPATAHMATRSRKGYWRMSQNEIVRFALNNRWLEEQ